MLDPKVALEKLNLIWEEVSRLSLDELQRKNFLDGDEEIKRKIELLVNSKIKSFKYAVLTQALAKLTDPSVNCLSLQVSAHVSGAFDARSFCKETVVRFEREKLNNILGGSSDPYVSKPLRHEEVSLSIIDHIKDKKGWRNLTTILSEIERRNDPSFTLKVVKQILLELRKSLLHRPILPPSIPEIGIEQLKEIIRGFLSRPSEGARPQSLIYALLKTFNNKTRTFSSITTAKATAPDLYARRLADIECRDDKGALKLAISVTDVLDTEKLKNELEKATANNVKNLLVIAHRIRIDEEATNMIGKYSLNVAISSVIDFISMMCVMLNSEMRRQLVVKVYETLQEQGYFDHLREWDNLIKERFS